MSMMKNSEFRRLMGYAQATRIHREHQLRASPAKRAAKSGGPRVDTKIAKGLRITSEPMERVFCSPNTYKSVRPYSSSQHMGT